MNEAIDACGRPWLSVVLPFYRKLDEFGRVLPLNAAYWSRAGIEVVVVLDEAQDEAALLALLDRWPGIRWKVVVNDQAHPWRPPCRAINVGVRHSAAPFLFIHSPESAYAADAPAQVLQIARNHPDAAVIGRVGFARFDEVGVGPTAVRETLDRVLPEALLLTTFYGSLCCARIAFESVGGYDERFTGWGGDDDDFRIRLEMSGCRLLACPELRLLHLSASTRTGGEQFDRDTDFARCTPTIVRANAHVAHGWGRDFARIVRGDDGPLPLPLVVPPFAGSDHAPVVAVGSRRQCELCGRMVHHEPPPVHCPRCSPVPVAAPNRLPIVCVLQVRNEARCLPGCLDHLRPYIDGFIALDDGSTDGTADILAREPKLIQALTNAPTGEHVWRENENRRRLLESARRHGAGWILMCDADERYEALFLAHLGAIVDSMPRAGLSCLSLRLCELWDTPRQFRADGVWGRKSRARLFRLPDAIDFSFSPPLHGTGLPDLVLQHGVMLRSWFNVYHLKMIRSADRAARRDFYNRSDPQRVSQPMGYDYLAEEGHALQLEAIGAGRDYDAATLPPDLIDLAKSPR